MQPSNASEMSPSRHIRPRTNSPGPMHDVDNAHMTTRRLVVVVTFVVVAVLGAVFAVSQWDHASRVATVASALATVAALGVAIWAALPGSGRTARVVRSGSATARGQGSRANSGVTGRAAQAGQDMASRTGNARAIGGGTANSGVELDH